MRDRSGMNVVYTISRSVHGGLRFVWDQDRRWASFTQAEVKGVQSPEGAR